TPRVNGEGREPAPPPCPRGRRAVRRRQAGGGEWTPRRRAHPLLFVQGPAARAGRHDRTGGPGTGDRGARREAADERRVAYPHHRRDSRLHEGARGSVGRSHSRLHDARHRSRGGRGCRADGDARRPIPHGLAWRASRAPDDGRGTGQSVCRRPTDIEVTPHPQKEETMNALVKRLAQSRILEGDLDYHLIRASMVIIFAFFGYQKWFEY